MAGRIKRLIDQVIEVRAGSNAVVAHFLKAHLMMNGVDPTRYTESSPDDPAKEEVLEQMLRDFSAGVK